MRPDSVVGCDLELGSESLPQRGQKTSVSAKSGTTQLPGFAQRARAAAPEAAVPERPRTLMLNVGLRCLSACPHCHHSCTPERTEVMSRQTMLECVRLADRVRPQIVDITGGEPELFEHLPDLIAELAARRLSTRVRTNLTALAEPSAAHLSNLFAEHGVGLLASLLGTSAATFATQRETSAWRTALKVLSLLNALGYGALEGGSRLRLDLAYNPPLGELPRPQQEIEAEFRTDLGSLGIRFDSLLAIANVPVGRFAERLKRQGAHDAYMEELAAAFNPATVRALDCRHGFEVAWDGTLWDCDFNLAARVRPASGPRTIEDALRDEGALAQRRIGFAQHCLACTSGSGSG